MTRKLHQATRRSPARGTSERLGTRLHNIMAERAESTSSVEISEQDSVLISSSSSTATAGRLLLNRLRCPKSSELARKRQVDRNPPRGKKRSWGQGASDPKSITPRQRVALIVCTVYCV